jgi:hypothetical protein
MLEYYDEVGHEDWTHAETGAAGRPPVERAGAPLAVSA